MARLKGFAFLIAFSWLSLLLPLIATASMQITDASFWEEKISVLVYRQAIGWDVRNAFQRVLASVRGGSPEEKAADLARKLAAFEAFLEKRYPVKAEAWAGPSFGVKQLLPRMLESQRVLKCGSCRDLSQAQLFPFAFGASFYGGDWAAVEVLA